MKHTSIALLGSVALGLLANQALAIQIVSTSTQSGRSEGQSVAVSADVDWEETGGITFVNPLIRTTRTVTATIAGITSDPPASISLTRDGLTGLYQGTFADLPAGAFTVKFTALRTVSDGTHIPVTTTRTSVTANRAVNVALPAGCFLFQNQSLQGFAARGFFNADTSTIVTPANFNPQWLASFGVLNANSSDGSFFLNLQGAQPPAASQVNGFYRFDIVSPDLSTNSAWQGGVTGVSFRYQATQLGALNLHAVLHVRKADGTTAVFTQFNADGTPLTSAAFAGSFQTMVDHVTLPAGSTVTGVDVRVFGQPGNILPSLMFDAICPRK